jgi:hypothetical protein
MAVTTADAGLRVGQVVGRTTDVIGRNAVAFLAMALAINVPMVILQLASARLQAIEGDLGAILSTALTVLAAVVVYLAGYVVLQAAIIHATVADLIGRRVTFGESISVGLREFFPLIAIGLLSAFGIALGILALVVPAFMLLCMWAVVVPVRIVERTRIFESFGRSRVLTRGNRWSIFLIFVILFGLQIALGMILGAFFLVFGVPDPGAGLFAPPALVQLIGNIISNTIGAVVGTAALAALYYELRALKEGIGPEALASVFD